MIVQPQHQLLSSTPIFLEGNKPWKLKLFVDVPLHSVQQIITYGNPHSNAMLSLFQLFHSLPSTHVQVHYYTTSSHKNDTIITTSSNYQYVVELCKTNPRLHLHEKNWTEKELQQYFASLTQQHDSFVMDEFLSKPILYLKQGFSNHILANYGISQLASQIATLLLHPNTIISKPVLVVLPSGSGMTSFYLAKYFYTHQLPIHIFTCNILLKKNSNLKKEICNMHPQNELLWEEMIQKDYFQVKEEKRRIFEWKTDSMIQMYQTMREEFGIEMDKRYSLFTMDTVIHHQSELLEKYSQIYYYHTGGTFGNHSLY